jgi:hypothetical protein
MALALPTTAQESGNDSVGRIVTQGGQKLSTDELRRIFPGATTTSLSDKGTRRWHNSPDGKFVAHGYNPNTTTPRAQSYQGFGTWEITEAGRYCVNIEWPKSEEKWCRVVFRLGEKYYWTDQPDDPNARAKEFELKQ